MKKVILLTFPLESLSYQAFSAIKNMHVQREIKGEQMAVITHRQDGTHQFDIKDFIDFTGKNHTAKNSMIGMLVGLFAGPLAMMLGWFTGSMIGGAQDAKEVATAKTIFEFVGEQIEEGQTGLILIAAEADNRPLNQLVFQELGGQITRLDLPTVMTEVEDAQQLEKEIKSQQPETKPTEE